MDFELFKKAIDQIAVYGSAIRFIGFSEPFMHPKIMDAIRYVKSKGLLLHITNNGTVLKKEQIDQLLEIGVDSVIFSMQGTTKEEYETIRQNDKYEKLIENAKTLFERRGKDRKSPSIKITTTITSRDSEESAKEFLQAHAAYTDEVQISGWTIFSRVSGDFNRNEIANNLGVLPFSKNENATCMIPLYEMSINSNGKVSPCCDDADESLVIGDINKQSLLEIWHSEKMKNVRDLTTSGKLDELTNCANCPQNFSESPVFAVHDKK